MSIDADSIRNDLENDTRQELVDKIVALKTHVEQLRNVIKKRLADESPIDEPTATRCSRREFDFAKHNKRHVALKFLYLGWHFDGYVVQEDTSRTVEAALFDALLKTRLIQSRETSNYHRCGRTDKGVSAFSQVISLDLRSRVGDSEPAEATSEEPRLGQDGDERDGKEIEYAAMLNRVLPPTIRVIGWAPVDRNFSARFDCRQRTYKYLFPKSSLDIEKMAKACQYLVGEHDFRNLCKMDVNNGVVKYNRKIFSAELVCDQTSLSDDGFSMCVLTIVGQAFLWHQIRCIVAVLFLVGQGKEQPEIIEKLLDVNSVPKKPQYCMASELPLILFDCQYDDCDVGPWHYDREALVDLIKHLQTLWTQEATKANVIKLMLNELQSLHGPECNCGPVEDGGGEQKMCRLSVIKCQADSLAGNWKAKIYKPLLERPSCESLDDRILKSKKLKKSSLK